MQSEFKLHCVAAAVKVTHNESANNARKGAPRPRCAVSGFTRDRNSVINIAQRAMT